MPSPEKHQRNETVCRAYKNGYSIREIALVLEISMQRVHQILVRAGVEMRPKHVTRHASNYEGRHV